MCPLKFELLVTLSLSGLPLGLFRLLGAEGSTNVQGETVKKLDVVANNAFKTSLSRSTSVQMMVTEEEPDAIIVADSEGHYVAVFDPLVFSSLSKLTPSRMDLPTSTPT
jgi:fructose-1,6-bisphosphatase